MSSKVNLRTEAATNAKKAPKAVEYNSNSNDESMFQNAESTLNESFPMASPNPTNARRTMYESGLYKNFGPLNNPLGLTTNSPFTNKNFTPSNYSKSLKYYTNKLPSDVKVYNKNNKKCF